MKRITRILARWKYRFDLGMSFLAVLNLAMITLSASGTIKEVLSIPAKVLVPVVVAIGVGGVLLFGTVLDLIRFGDAYLDELNERNRKLTEIHGKVHRP